MEIPPTLTAEQTAARGWVLALEDAFHDEHAAQVRQVELIHHLCSVYAALDPSRPALPGQERLIRAGADGTPWIAEHLVTELAPKLRLSIDSCGGLLMATMDLVCRHPLLWAATKAGRLTVWQARHLAATTSTAGLTAEAAAWVDHQLEPSLGRLAWGRLKRRLANLIVRADTALAAKKAAQAQNERFVRISHNGDGTAYLTAKTDSLDAVRITHMLTQIAGQLTLAGDTNEPDVLRATALGILADPHQTIALLNGPDHTDQPQPGAPGRRRRGTRTRPKAELVIHFTPGDHVGHSDHLGPVLADQVRTWLGHHQVTVRPVVDLNDNPTVNSYTIPDRIARIVRWRNPFDVFPYSSRHSTGLDLDHTQPYQHGPDQPPGQTSPNNLGPLSRRAHRAKTHAGWQLTQPFPGTYHWQSPLGFRYQTDPTGSHQLPDHPTHPAPSQPVPTTTDGRGPRPDYLSKLEAIWLQAS